jgi:hypothetical protein
MIAQDPFLLAERGREADPFILQLFAALAEKERSKIGTRTKTARSSRRTRYEAQWTKAEPANPQECLCLPVGSSTRPVRGLTQCNREHAMHLTD